MQRSAHIKNLQLGSSTSVYALGTALAVTFGCSAAFAQAAKPAPAADAAAPEEIIVTGFRASLASAVAEKKKADQIVESVSAEDIGKLPDASIAESIARLPGLTSQRLSGRSNVISIRGFAPDYSNTLLNGREQTSTGDNRAVEYDQYPSEVINRVNVYKTPNASLVAQGLSGTVDLRTIRPLAFGKRMIALGARGEYTDNGKLNAKSDTYGYRANATYVDQFADDTLGIALSASYNRSPYQTKEFNAWGYNTVNGNALIGGEKSYATSSNLTRLGLQASVDYKVNENIMTSVDAFYSDFKDHQIKRGVELPLGFGAFGTGFNAATATAKDGTYVAGTFTTVEGVVRNDAFERNSKLYSVGWNTKYTGDNGWQAMADIGYSKTDRNELVFESYSGTGRGEGVGARDTIGFTSGPTGTVFKPTLNYGDYNLIQLTSPLGWGGDQTAVDGTRIRGGQDGYYNNRLIKDELWQLRAEVEKQVGAGFMDSVKIGVNFTKRDKSLRPDEAFIGLVSNTNGLTSQVVPDQYRLGTTNLEFLGLGPVISYNPIALLNGGIYKRVANPYGDVVVKSFSIREKIVTAYIQSNVKTAIGDNELTGNYGVQAVFTDQSSQGAQAAFLGTNANGSPNIAGIVRKDGAKYVDVLPSINLSLRFPSDFVIRFGAAREMMRPRLDDMRASTKYDVNNTSRIVTGDSGNPRLRPWRANAVDLTFEKYFGSKAYIAAQIFYKELLSYIVKADNPFDFTGLPLAPTTFTPIRQGFLNVPTNGNGGSIAGIEFAGNLPLELFSPALDGFGVTGSVANTTTRIKPVGAVELTELPGFSKWVVNGTGYFEKYGFSARGSVRYRTTFVGELSGFGAARTFRRARGETIIDGQLGYEFQDGTALQGLSLYLQGQNLTNQAFATVDPGNNPLKVIDYQTYGRRFLFGANYKF